MSGCRLLPMSAACFPSQLQRRTRRLEIIAHRYATHAPEGQEEASRRAGDWGAQVRPGSHRQQSGARGSIRAWRKRLRRRSQHTRFVCMHASTAGQLEFHAGFVDSLQKGGIFDYIPTNFVDQFTHLVALAHRVKALPQIQAYYASK